MWSEGDKKSFEKKRTQILKALVVRQVFEDSRVFSVARLGRRFDLKVSGKFGSRHEASHRFACDVEIREPGEVGVGLIVRVAKLYKKTVGRFIYVHHTEHLKKSKPSFLT